MNKQEIQEALDALRKATRKLRKKSESLAGARSDAQQFQAQIEKIGEPHYKDEASMLKLSTLERQFAACEKIITSSENEMEALIGEELIALTVHCGGLVATILGDAHSRRVATVTAVFRPFFREEFNANQAAIRSDACLVGMQKMSGWNSISMDSRVSNGAQEPERLLEVLTEIETVFTESLKDSPDLQQFIPFNPPLMAAGNNAAQG